MLKSNRNFLREDGKPYNYDDSKIRNCKVCGKKLHHCSKTGYCALHYMTDDYRLRLSESVKLAYTDGRKKYVGYKGFSKSSSPYKKGFYKGYWCDSSWELAYVIYNLEKGITFARNTKAFKYEYEGKTYLYYPDFIECQNKYKEIKGYETKKDSCKLRDFPYDIELLDRPKMRRILEYVKNKYGKDFYKMYD